MKREVVTKESFWISIALASTLLAIPLHFILATFYTQSINGIEIANIPLLLIIFAIGIPFTIQMGLKLLHRNFGADLLAVISLITGVWLGEYLAATLIILMLTGGQMLELYALRKASSALRLLADRVPSFAHRKSGDDIEEIPLNKILIGDLIVIFPHETAPVDGIVIEGQGTMDESYLTGEPYHVSKTMGASVLSGAINGASVLTIRTEKLAEDSRYAQILTVMQDAEQKRPMIRRLGDQIGALFAPFALLFALIVWYVTGDASRFLSVLVVATPCPLLIAIPITLMSAISIAAKHGIIIKDPVVLERLPTCRTAIFDKTGTLTYGKPELTNIITADSIDQNYILTLAASMERYSKHPLASAILNAAQKRHLQLLNAETVSEKPGQGLTALINNRNISITHRRKLLQIQPDILNLLPPTTAGLECIVMMDNYYAATFQFRDMPRTDGKSFISHLSPAHHFKKIMLVSGDRDSEVKYLATLLGIKHTLSAQSPEQKVNVVRAETMLAPTLFMGDGINDAPALTSATVGIAFGQYSSVTAEAAGAVILENTLTKVDELIHISMSMRRIMLQSVIGGMTLSILAMGFATGGYITPVIGAILQEIIDIMAIANALRLAWYRKIETDINQ